MPNQQKIATQAEAGCHEIDGFVFTSQQLIDYFRDELGGSGLIEIVDVSPFASGYFHVKYKCLFLDETPWRTSSKRVFIPSFKSYLHHRQS